MANTDISQEPLQNKVAKDLGTHKAWRVVNADNLGNILIAESLTWEIRYDYAGRADGQPVYIGYVIPGTVTSIEAWLIHKFTYNGDGFITQRQVVTDKAWDNRSSEF